MKRAVSVALIAVALPAGSVSAQWPQWRGPARDGSVPAASVPAAWPETAALTWKQPIGEGYSSPVVDGGRVFVHSRRDPEEVISAFDLATGKPAWTDTYAAPFGKNPYAKQMAKGPFSTPLVSGGRLFTLGASAVLSAYDAASGRRIWRQPRRGRRVPLWAVEPPERAVLLPRRSNGRGRSGRRRAAPRRTRRS